MTLHCLSAGLALLEMTYLDNAFFRTLHCRQASLALLEMDLP